MRAHASAKLPVPDPTSTNVTCCSPPTADDRPSRSASSTRVFALCVQKYSKYAPSYASATRARRQAQQRRRIDNHGETTVPATLSQNACATSGDVGIACALCTAQLDACAACVIEVPEKARAAGRHPRPMRCRTGSTRCLHASRAPRAMATIQLSIWSRCDTHCEPRVTETGTSPPRDVSLLYEL